MTDVILIGCGAVSNRYYAPALRELERTQDVRVVGLFDPGTCAVMAMAAHFPHATVLSSLEQLERLRADLAIIASPPRFHAHQSIAAMRSGMSVLCEKPMAVSMDEAHATVEASIESGRTLTVNLIRRLLPATRTIHEILRTGVLGRVTSFTGFEGGPFAWPVASSKYFSRSESGGGVLFDLGSHALDLVVWWFGEPLEVACEDDGITGVEVNCRIQMRFANGATGRLMLSREWTRPNEYVIRCERGWIRWAVGDADAVQMGLEGCDHGLDARLCVQGVGSRLCSGADVHTFERCFVEAVRVAATPNGGGVMACATWEDGLRSLALVERCYRSRTVMTMPWLSDAENDRARKLATGG